MDAIAWIAEQRIREAMDQVAFKVLEDAGCLPPEVELRREVASLSELLDTIAEGPDRQRIRRELSDCRLRLELLRRHR